ncbi:MAG TPA: heavy metal translocating P-type ATPase, partial [Thermodesulfobacteriota bacterium]|nr:heavy metal translocating P-type ATPase [Thermodesulfobacteriota bacterium]
MAIPYDVKSLMPGRFQIKSEFFKYISVSEDGIRNFFIQKEGVSKVKISKKTGNLTIEYEPKKFDLGEFFKTFDTATPEYVIRILSEAENGNGKKEKGPEIEGGARKWFISNTLALVPFLLRIPIPAGFLTGVTLVLALPIFKKALGSVKNRKIDVHLLDSSAIALATLQGSSLSSMLMVWLLSLGDLIEEKTQGKARKEIEKLLSYQDEKAWLITEEEKTIQVPVDQVKKGDKIVVYTGEKISIDGVVFEGEALINQASLTGESNPVLKRQDAKVYAGTFVEDGKLYVIAEKIGQETALAKIVSIIQESINEPIETQKKAENLANKFVIPTILTSGGIYGATRNLGRTVSTLTFDYHTGVHVSTPTAIMSHMALAAKRGILVKSGRHLEILHNVDTMVFDKTGTLTVGYPEITEIIPYKVSEEEALALAASLEQRLTHPVARSIVQRALDRNLELLPRKESNYHRGLGIEAHINGNKLLIGSTKFMEKTQTKISREIEEDVDRLHEKGVSVLYLVKNKTIIALLGFADPIRPESKRVVEVLHGLGREVILCTGDNEGAAEIVARNLGIDKYHARAFPDEKARIIKSLKRAGRTVAFLGDGVNDSPALSVADIGISINSGADIAIEVADVVINNDLRYLIESIKISDMALRNIEQNYRINTVANTIGMIGA